MLVVKGLIGLHKPFNFSFFSVTGWGIDLDNCDIEWFALETCQQGPLLIEDSAELGALYKHSLVGIYLLPDQTPQLLSWDPDSAS